MKRFIILISVLLIGFVSFAQERTITKNMGSDTYFHYGGTADDTLIATNQDTIDLVIQYKGGGWIRKVAVKSRFDTIAGADTTVAISVYGKEFYDDATYVQIIASTLSSAVTTENIVKVVTSDYTETTTAFDVDGYDEITTDVDTLAFPAQTVTPLDKSYRYYRIRYILQGDYTVGTGILLDDVELLLYTE